MRQKFMDHIYKSTQMVALEEAVALSVKRPNVKAPLTDSYGTPSPVSLVLHYLILVLEFCNSV